MRVAGFGQSNIHEAYEKLGNKTKQMKVPQLNPCTYRLATYSYRTQAPRSDFPIGDRCASPLRGATPTPCPMKIGQGASGDHLSFTQNLQANFIILHLHQSNSATQDRVGPHAQTRRGSMCPSPTYVMVGTLNHPRGRGARRPPTVTDVSRLEGPGGPLRPRGGHLSYAAQRQGAFEEPSGSGQAPHSG